MYPLKSYRQDIPILNATVSVSRVSDIVEVGNTEGPISMQLAWEIGSSPDIDVSLEASNNKTIWTTMGGSASNIITNSGNLMWDLPLSTGAEFIRISFVVNSGSASFSAFFNGKSR